MRPRRQDINIIFLHLGHVANRMGERYLFLKIFLFDIYFWNFIFLNIKIKKATLAQQPSAPLAHARRCFRTEPRSPPSPSQTARLLAGIGRSAPRRDGPGGARAPEALRRRPAAAGGHSEQPEGPLRPLRARGGGAGDAVSGRHGPRLRLRRVPGRRGDAQGARREGGGRAQCLLRPKG